jgi:hypothetical protein
MSETNGKEFSAIQFYLSTCRSAACIGTDSRNSLSSFTAGPRARCPGSVRKEADWLYGHGHGLARKDEPNSEQQNYSSKLANMPRPRQC